MFSKSQANWPHRNPWKFPVLLGFGLSCFSEFVDFGSVGHKVGRAVVYNNGTRFLSSHRLCTAFITVIYFYSREDYITQL